MEQIRNSIQIRGQLQSLPEFSHENHGRRFYRFTLEIPRLSGTVDALPVVVEQPLLDALDPSGGELLTVTGQIRSHNRRENGVRHLLIYVYAQQLTAEAGPPLNEVYVEGVLCREPVYRRTPLGREICDTMLAVQRNPRRADYLPCILWGRTAQLLADCQVRDRVSIYGRLQSRSYTKLTETGPIQRTAYEISALRAEFPDEPL